MQIELSTILIKYFISLAIIGAIIYFKRKQNGKLTTRLAISLIMALASLIPAIIEALFSNGEAGLASVPLLIASLVMALWPQKTDEQISSYTFKEKSDFIILVSIVIIYGFGSFMILQNPNSANGLYWILVSSIAFISIIILSHIILAITHKPEDKDERDNINSWRSSKNAYSILSVGIWICLAIILISQNIFTASFALFGTFILAEVVRLASSLFYYRYAP